MRPVRVLVNETPKEAGVLLLLLVLAGLIAPDIGAGCGYSSEAWRFRTEAH